MEVGQDDKSINRLMSYGQLVLLLDEDVVDGGGPALNVDLSRRVEREEVRALQVAAELEDEELIRRQRRGA